MHYKYLFLFWVLLLVTGCTTPGKIETVWPRKRPLGRDLEAWRPPDKPLSENDSGQLKIEEPTGILTLRQALSLALMKNPKLAAFAWEVRAREAGTLQAGLFPNPELEAVMENFGGRNNLQGVDGAQTTLQLSQLIPLGGKISKRKKAAALGRDLAGWDYEINRLDVLTGTTRALVSVLAAQERLALVKELVHLSEQVLDTVAKRVKAGKVSPLEESKAKVILSFSRIQLEQARRRLKAVRKRLAAFWGGSSPAFERVDGRLDALKPIPPAQQLDRFLSQNPDIARRVGEIALAKAVVEREKANSIPDITIQGGVQQVNSSGGPDDNAFLIGVSIPLQLFNRNQGGVLQAQYRLARSRKERQAAQVEVSASLTETYQELAASYAVALALRDEVLPAAQKAFEAAGTGYRHGKFGYLQVLDAQRTLFQAKGQYIQALTAYHQGVAKLERLIGTGLEQLSTVTRQSAVGS